MFSTLFLLFNFLVLGAHCDVHGRSNVNIRMYSQDHPFEVQPVSNKQYYQNDNCGGGGGCGGSGGDCGCCLPVDWPEWMKCACCDESGGGEGSAPFTEESEELGGEGGGGPSPDPADNANPENPTLTDTETYKEIPDTEEGNYPAKLRIRVHDTDHKDYPTDTMANMYNNYGYHPMPITTPRFVYPQIETRYYGSSLSDLINNHRREARNVEQNDTDPTVEPEIITTESSIDKNDEFQRMLTDPEISRKYRMLENANTGKIVPVHTNMLRSEPPREIRNALDLVKRLFRTFSKEELRLAEEAYANDIHGNVNYSHGNKFYHSSD